MVGRHKTKIMGGNTYAVIKGLWVFPLGGVFYFYFLLGGRVTKNAKTSIRIYFYLSKH